MLIRSGDGTLVIFVVKFSYLIIASILSHPIFFVSCAFVFSRVTLELQDKEDPLEIEDQL